MHKIVRTRNKGVLSDDVRKGLCAHGHGNCIIFFRVANDETIVVRVWHGARDLEKLSFGDEFG